VPPADRMSPQWPRFTERFLNDILDKEIARRCAPIETFLGHKGTSSYGIVGCCTAAVRQQNPASFALPSSRITPA
jgi:hypothetical protein